jgi:hypothetical protein
MTCVSQCPINLRAEHPLRMYTGKCPHVQADWNISTVALRVVEGEENRA